MWALAVSPRWWFKGTLTMGVVMVVSSFRVWLCLGNDVNELIS